MLKSGFSSILIILIIVPLLVLTAGVALFVFEGNIDIANLNSFTPNYTRDFNPEEVMVDKTEDESEPTPIPKPTPPPTPQPEPDPYQISSGLTSNTMATIEDGASLQITKATFNTSVMTIHVKFANSSGLTITVYPLRLSLRSLSKGYAPTPAITQVEMAPGASIEYDLTYTVEDTPPFTFKYTNSNDTQIEVGKFN